MTPPGLLELLADHLGLASDSLGERLLSRAATDRMRVAGIPDGATYVRRLRTDRAELDALVEQVVVPETWFFRYPKSLTFLAEWARQRRTVPGERRTLRIFSVPSSTGEEPYSVAMALLLAGLPPTAFAIEACDVSARAIERAAAGVYPPSAFRERDTPDLSAFFEVVGTNRRVRAEVRRTVSLRVGNVCDTRLFAGRARYDVILCRNLFIYLTESTRKSALNRFEKQLTAGGLLFMGHAEPASLFDARFALAGPPAAFAFGRAEVKPMPAVVKRAEFPTPTAEVLTRPAVVADKPSADGYAKLGARLRDTGDLAGAERALTEAVYLEPRHRGALAGLLALAEARGDWAGAANYRRRVGLAGGG